MGITVKMYPADPKNPVKGFSYAGVECKGSPSAGFDVPLEGAEEAKHHGLSTSQPGAKRVASQPAPESKREPEQDSEAKQEAKQEMVESLGEVVGKKGKKW